MKREQACEEVSKTKINRNFYEEKKLTFCAFQVMPIMISGQLSETPDIVEFSQVVPNRKLKALL